MPYCFINKMRILLSFLLLLPICSLMAQTAVNSPYSRYGIGDIMYNRYSKNMAMGGVSLALREPADVNFLNPASYTSVDTNSFVFTTGVRLGLC
jgi:hypothetical protein